MNEKTWAWPRPPPWSFAAALAFAMALPATAGEAETPFKLDMPLSCVAGETCWIVNYVDHDPTDGIRDYACGTATYNGSGKVRAHKGTDIAIRDLAQMKSGVPGLAAAAGRVTGVRDGMKDVDFTKTGGPESVKGRECGNGVMIDHGGDWRTQYCHMRQGSIAVGKGDRVAAGQTIGMVGLSGLSEFTHLHFQVLEGKAFVDPFTGPGKYRSCGPGPGALWKKSVLARLPYRPTALYNAGFATGKPRVEMARAGLYRTKTLSRMAPALVLWADMFHVRKGDEMTITITGPGGERVHQRRFTFGKRLARAWRFSGVKRKTAAWPEGRYRGEIRLRRPGPEAREHFISREVVLR
ncbi:MAG: M23 family metallopeptidase [Rhodospirillales bacterium]